MAFAPDLLALTLSTESLALRQLRTQFEDPMIMCVCGRVQPTPWALLLADRIAPVLRSLRRALEPPAPFVPATTGDIFRSGMHAAPGFIAQVTTETQTAVPDAMLDGARIKPSNKNDLSTV